MSYSNPDEAYVAAEELEHHADTLAEQLRRSGKEGEADTVQDRGHADADKLRTWAREQQASEAEQTEQPADTPAASRAATPRKGGGRRRATRVRAHTRGAARRSSTFTPRTRSIARQTGIPQATSSATSLALQVAGLTLGIAFLTLLLSRRGVQSFAELAGGAGHALDRLILPVDPLAPRPKLAAAQHAAGAAATAAARTAVTRRRVVRAPVASVAGAVQ